MFRKSTFIISFTKALSASCVACIFAVSAVIASADETPRVDLYGDPLPSGAIARLGTVRFRHRYLHGPGGLFSGRQIGGVRLHADGTVIIWDSATGNRLRQFKGHPGKTVDALSFSNNGKTLVSGRR